LKRFLLILFLMLLTAKGTRSQDTLSFWEPAPTLQKDRVRGVSIGLAAGYTASMAGLYSLWYADYPHSDFHTFDDNNEWLQVDKAGHLGSAYYLGKWGIDLFQWTGMEKKKATWIGGTAGLAFLTTIEIFDGYSEEWGFSTGDMIANCAGTAMAISQELLWEDQRIKIKFSWHATDYAQYNPDLLGDDFPETLFKDYNGQTYWLSANISSFFPASKFPEWLNFSVGYGAEGMTSAGNEPSDSEIADTPDFERYRQFYIAPDIELSNLKVKSKLLKSVFGVFGFIKFPAPAIEINGNDQVKFHWLYF
jgi:uncharacterized protein YfiM (DUF2279 family)